MIAERWTKTYTGFETPRTVTLVIDPSSAIPSPHGGEPEYRVAGTALESLLREAGYVPLSHNKRSAEDA